jgi:hypothetical protein
MDATVSAVAERDRAVEPQPRRRRRLLQPPSHRAGRRITVGRLATTAKRHPTVSASRPVVVDSLLALIAVALAIFAVAMLVRNRPPGDGSAEAGFARDMTTHHAQAVRMALTMFERAEDPQIRI